MSKRITVVGSANIDYTIVIPRLPQKGETLGGGSFNIAFGGKGSNQAIAARRAGSDVTVVMSLGDDAMGAKLLEEYRQEGMDVASVVVHPGISTGTAVIQVDRNGDNTIALATGANGLLTVDQVRAAEGAIARSAVIMFQMEIPDEPMAEAIRLARKHGAEVMLNFAPVRKTDLVMDADIAILAVNEIEAGSLTGMNVETQADAEKAVCLLAEKGHRLVLLTLGGKGCMIWEKGKTTGYPAFKVAAVDATAAGDTFCGAFATALAEGMDTPSAVRFASASAAVCVQKPGALASIPYRREVEEFLRKNA